MENIKTESITDGNESEAEQGSIKEKSENSLIDITTLDFKSRLCLKTTEMYGEAGHTNGISRVNGVCNSPERTASTTNLPESQSMETSHLNQQGTRKWKFVEA